MSDFIVTLTTYLMLAYSGEIVTVERGPFFGGQYAMEACLAMKHQREFTYTPPDGYVAVTYCDPYYVSEPNG